MATPPSLKTSSLDVGGPSLFEQALSDAIRRAIIKARGRCIANLDVDIRLGSVGRENGYRMIFFSRIGDNVARILGLRLNRS